MSALSIADKQNQNRKPFVPEIVPPEPPLSLQRRATQALARVIKGIFKSTEKTEREVIALLPSLTLTDVIKTRATAKAIYASAWRIEIACDAEIWKRHENLIHSGVKDTGERGIMAAVNKRAKEIGCSASNVRANARLWNQFSVVLSTQHNCLNDKAFFQAALEADDPDKAIEKWTLKRMDDPSFKPADAWREVKPIPPELTPDLKVLESPTVRTWLEKQIADLRAKFETVPEEAGFLRDMLVSQIEAYQWQLARTIESDKYAVRDAVREILGTWQQVFAWLKQRSMLISPPDVRDRLTLLETEGRVKSKEEEGRKVGQKGSMKTVWLPLRNSKDDERDDEKERNA
jgi:hypothetical protein